MTIKDIVELLKDCDFNELAEDNCDEKIWEKVVDQANENISFGTGASKCAIILPERNIVIKIPYCGYFMCEDVYDEDMDAWFEDDDPVFCEFEGAYNHNDVTDYCLSEAELYHDALMFDKEVAKLFVKTSFVCTVKDHPIYIQPLCEVLENRDYSSSSHTREQLDSTVEMCRNKKLWCFNTEWLTDVLLCYGQEVFEKFMTFIEESRISDLHSGNLGYLDGRPVVIDYAGFCS